MKGLLFICEIFFGCKSSPVKLYTHIYIDSSTIIDIYIPLAILHSDSIAGSEIPGVNI